MAKAYDLYDTDKVYNNTANVSVGGGVEGAYFFTAPVGTPLPITPWDDLDPVFEPLGFISSDGVTNAIDRSSDAITDLNGEAIASSRGDRAETLALTFAEVKAATLREIYGYKNVTDDKGFITAHSNNAEQQHRSYVAALVFRDERIGYLVVPNGQCYVTGELTINSTTLFGRESTITCYADEAGDTALWLIESTETVRPVHADLKRTGEMNGIDVSKLGAFFARGNTISGVANKVTVPEWSSQTPKEKQGYFVALHVDDAKTVKTASTPEGKSVDETGDILMLLGEESPEDKWIEIVDKQDDSVRYTFDVEAAKA